ncbi:hypothetical protein LWI28_018791 [Acer negundo]|uniref:Uncharacterized protein n=1 Tax=Acer negundo TaxID=4023 RepID=A0AAD5NV11_ACENE|nr:hypothetical protein LWI28_018791 [Acer negundo]
MERAEKYATTKDICQTKTKDMASTALKQQTLEPSSRTPFKGRFDKYTPLKHSLDRIYEIASKSRLLQIPEPIHTPLEKKSRRLHYKFHQDHGHETKNYNSLRDQIEELVRSGKLQECVKIGGIASATGERAPTGGRSKGNKQDSDDDEPINFILTEAISGESASSSLEEKSAYIYMVTTPEDPTGSWSPISFLPSNSTGVRYPHCDALIISVKIRNRTVKRVLINHGSSMDIIYWDPLQKLVYTLQQL